MISVSDVITESRTYIGTPYRHQGRSKTGVDCLGLLILVAEGLGISVEETPNYALKVKPDVLISGLLRYSKRTRTREIRPGVLALMEFNPNAGATHTALITDLGMIHSYNKRGRVVEHRLNDVWKSRIVATFRLNGVCYE